MRRLLFITAASIALGLMFLSQDSAARVNSGGTVVPGNSTLAPVGASYVVLSADSKLTNERILTEGLAVDATDGGAGGNLTLAFDPTELLGSRTFGDGSTDTIVWTFDRATGTDPALTFNSGALGLNGDIDLDAENPNYTLQHTGGDEFGLHTEAGSLLYIRNNTDGVSYLQIGGDHITYYGDPLVPSHVFRTTNSGDAAFQAPAGSIGGGEMIAATSSAQGAVQLATTAEISASTETSKVMTPDAFSASIYGQIPKQWIPISDATSVTTGDGAGDAWWTVPPQYDGWKIVAAYASCQTAGVTGTMDIQIRNVTDSVDVLSTKITIETNEKTSFTSGVPSVVNESNNTIQTGDEITSDVDAVHSGTAAKGLQIILIIQAP